MTPISAIVIPTPPVIEEIPVEIELMDEVPSKYFKTPSKILSDGGDFDSEFSDGAKDFTRILKSEFLSTKPFTTHKSEIKRVFLREIKNPSDIKHLKTNR